MSRLPKRHNKGRKGDGQIQQKTIKNKTASVCNSVPLELEKILLFLNVILLQA